MITREELMRIPELNRQIQRDKERLRLLREKATSVPCTTREFERVQETVENRAGRYIDAAVDLANEIRLEESELEELKTRAKLFIKSLPKGTRKERLTVSVLKLRYLECNTWEEISNKKSYSERHLRRLANTAIEGKKF